MHNFFRLCLVQRTCEPHNCRSEEFKALDPHPITGGSLRLPLIWGPMGRGPGVTAILGDRWAKRHLTWGYTILICNPPTPLARHALYYAAVRW